MSQGSIVTLWITGRPLQSKVIHSLKEVAMTEDQKNQQKNDAQPGDIGGATL